jgi:hypothetical protein
MPTNVRMPPNVRMPKTTATLRSISSATLNSNGVATLTRSDLNAGFFPLVAKYSGKEFAFLVRRVESGCEADHQRRHDYIIA